MEITDSGGVYATPLEKMRARIGLLSVGSEAAADALPYLDVQSLNDKTQVCSIVAGNLALLPHCQGMSSPGELLHRGEIEATVQQASDILVTLP